MIKLGKPVGISPIMGIPCCIKNVELMMVNVINANSDGGMTLAHFSGQYIMIKSVINPRIVATVFCSLKALGIFVSESNALL